MSRPQATRCFDVAIVGGGHAGAQAAIALRQQKFTGSIAILSDESEAPYERPPLSKEYLAGEKSFERILIRPVAFWRERQVELLLGHRVIKVDAQAHQLETAQGLQCRYHHLIWAAGGAPRRLSCDGSDLGGVHAIRNRADVDQLLQDLQEAKAAVVIGGGFIGLEAAAVLIKLGKRVTLLEALPRVLARVAGEKLSRFYEAEHRSHGVDLRTGVSVECLVGEAGRVSGVKLSDGTVISAEVVIVGIGIIPSVEPLVLAGAAGSNGVEVDEFCRTNLPDVYAAGDCALHQNAYADGQRIRVESVQNANDMATIAARSIAGTAVSYDAIPWFWSNQYDLRLQTVGLSGGHDETVLRGVITDRKFSVIYLKLGRVIALDAVNSTKDYVQARALVVGRAAPDPTRLADPEVPLKDLS